MQKQFSPDDIRQAVQKDYGKIAQQGISGCGCSVASDCCGETTTAEIASINMGYSIQELKNLPEGSNLGLGCGNPQAIADLKIGETVLDLGSGAGIDCFLAANQVGKTGKVIGVDMTPDMLRKARDNAKKGAYENVEFRLGEIEALPVADSSIDVIISNCVVNLSPDKNSVFLESFRVLKSGGRLAISDIVMTAELPDTVLNDLSLYSACVTGASTIDELKSILKSVGFQKINIQPKEKSREFIKEWSPENKVENYVVSATIEAVKP